MALKYKVKHTSIMHNKTVYKEGSTIELDDTQAKRLEDFVELLPNQSAPAKSKAQTQTSKTASTGNKKAYLITTEAKLSKQYLKFSPTLGIAYNGNYLILSSSEYLKTGKECTLLDVMEKNVPEKYFLSPEAIQKIIAKSE